MAINVKWAKGQRQDFTRWLSTELHNALADRQTLERRWADWVEQYKAPRRAAADFPFPGASNEEYPLTAMHAEPVLADMLQSIHAARNLWTAVDLSGDFTDSVSAITEYLTLIDRLHLDMRCVNRRVFPDLIILGTGVYYHNWRFERRKTKIVENDDVVDKIVTSNQPAVQHIPLSDFIWPANSWDINPDAPVAPARWVGHRFRLTENQLRQRSKGQEPFLPNYDKTATDAVLHRETTEETTVEKKIREVDEHRPYRDWKIELFEIHARFDVDNDGIDEDVIVVWHQRSGHILRAIYNPFAHGHRPYEVEQYIQTFSLLGEGIGSMSEMPQNVLSKLLNAQVDNVLLANTRMFGYPEGMAIRPNEPVYPGKMWPLRPGEQMQEIKMGEVYPSLFSIIQQFLQMQEQRTSISDVRQGDISSLPSRTPATTVINLLTESNKKFSMIQGNIRQGALANIGKRMFQMISQRHQAGDGKWAQLARDMLGPTDSEKVIQALSLEQSIIDEGLGIEVTATSGQVNKEVQKQSLIGLAQFLSQAYPQLNQAAQIMGDQQLAAATAQSTFNGGVEILRRLLEAFDIQNPERYLPPTVGQQAGTNGLGAQQNQLGLQSQVGGPLGPQPFAQGAPQLARILGIGG